jgi:hypothetical protein
MTRARSGQLLRDLRSDAGFELDHDQPGAAGRRSEHSHLRHLRRGGGYYDSGYIQPISFFGDGTCVPMIAISPYAKAGFISHS